jgi:hypothetical protein
MSTIPRNAKLTPPLSDDVVSRPIDPDEPGLECDEPLPEDSPTNPATLTDASGSPAPRPLRPHGPTDETSTDVDIPRSTAA